LFETPPPKSGAKLATRPGEVKRAKESGAPLKPSCESCAAPPLSLFRDVARELRPESIAGSMSGEPFTPTKAGAMES
jgi:hypothetical protein